MSENENIHILPFSVKHHMQN